MNQKVDFLITAVQNNDESQCSLLLDNKANPNTRHSSGDSVLHTASLNGNVNICRALIDAKARVDIKTLKQNTSLH